MKDARDPQFRLYLFAPCFFQVFAEWSFLLIEGNWEIVPYMLFLEFSFFILPPIVATRFFRKALKPLAENWNDKSPAALLFMRIQSIYLFVISGIGLGYIALIYCLLSSMENIQVYMQGWHFCLSMASSYAILPGFLAWIFAGFWTESFRIRLHREEGIVLPAGETHISVQLLLFFSLVLGLPVFTLMLDVRVWVLHPGPFASVFWSDLISILTAIVLAVVVFTQKITKPIGFLEKAMDQVVAGDLGLSVPVLGNDEIGRLTIHFNHMLEGLREREFLHDTFGKYLSPELAKAILAKGGAIRPENRVVTILFTDIENYTALSENLPPSEVVKMLDEYFSGIIGIVSRHLGAVNKFMGDAVMALFNAPIDDPDHAFHAVEAGLEIDRLCREGSFSGRKLITRIGINTGTVVAGNIGSANRMEYTVIGDVVNVAQRLEAQNKQFGTTILAGPLTRDLCGDRVDFIARGEIMVKGRSAPLIAWSPEYSTADRSISATEREDSTGGFSLPAPATRTY
ncbi:MAG: adenylate/guanylate cyclase domain-containing protein [Pseudomonadota bacterium]